jgi:predicted nucleic acid-binding protein
MAIYVDTSFLLNTIYLEEGYKKHVKLLEKEQYQFSSILLEIETFRNLNYVRMNRKSDDVEKWFNKKLTYADELLSRINLKNIDKEVRDEIRKNRNICELKSLDSIHLGTAIFLRNMISEELIFLTLDDKLKSIAKKFGFKKL